MFGQTTQGTAPQPTSSLEERAFVDRSRGLYSFRYATPLWYNLSMNVAKNWRVDGAAPVAGVDAVKIIPSSLLTDQRKLQRAYDWIKQAQDAGFGVVVATEILAKTKSAEIAGRLTDEDDSAFVLNEPSGDWDDVGLSSAMLIVPAILLVGAIGSMLIMENSR